MSKHSSRKTRAVELVVIAGVAGTVVACGGKAVEMAGEVMEDAGRAMSDAGAAMMEDAGRVMSDAGAALSDAGMALTDAGGHWLSDAGEVVADAGREMRDASGQMAEDAEAQETACGTCTASGARRVIVASEDPERLVGGTVAGAGWTKNEEPFSVQPFSGTAWIYHSLLASGPAVVTDVLVSGGQVSLYAVSAGTPCFERVVNGSDPAQQTVTFRVPSNARALLGASNWTLTGARLLVKGGEALCASAGSGSNTTVPAPAQMVWTAFRPYE